MSSITTSIAASAAHFAPESLLLPQAQREAGTRAAMPTQPEAPSTASTSLADMVPPGGLHPVAAGPVAAETFNFIENSRATVIKAIGDGLQGVIEGGTGPGPEGGGFSGFLHTIANLGRG
jgi:hypothetical protein